uniref:Uncharacterized protein n=1 Tax=viral metagenome TaxID=1070528 RepID=A0A6C0JIF0_9ZZZZ
MSNPPPVKVSPRPTRRDVDENIANTGIVSVPLSTIPQPPSYSFPSPETRDLRIVAANFVYGEQSVDCIKYIKPHISYGYVEYPMKSLLADLKDANAITDVDNADALNLHPPKLFIKYIDPEGYHSKEFAMEDIIIMGKLTAWGLFLKKPGELSMKAGLAAGKIQFWFAVAVFWVLMIVWAYKLWDHMGTNNLRWSTATKANFGEYGQWFALFAAIFAQIGLTKYVMAFIAALAPVWSFCIQFALWFFVDSQIYKPLQ